MSNVLQQVRDVSHFMCMFLKSCWSPFKFVPALLKSAGSNSSEKIAHNFHFCYQHGCGRTLFVVRLCSSAGHLDTEHGLPHSCLPGYW